MSVSGVSPLHVSVSLLNIPNAPVLSMKFTSPIIVSLSTRVVSPSVPANTTTSPSNVVVTGIPIIPFTSYPLFQNFYNNPSGSTPFVQGYPWYGGNIPPPSPYVSPTRTYLGMSSGS